MLKKKKKGEVFRIICLVSLFFFFFYLFFRFFKRVFASLYKDAQSFKKANEKSPSQSAFESGKGAVQFRAKVWQLLSGAQL